MAYPYLFFITIFILFITSNGQKVSYDGAENELTITVTAGQLECFYQKVKTGNTLELEYQVCR